MSEHFKITCKVCSKTIAQCRCSEPKDVRKEICEDCSKKTPPNIIDADREKANKFWPEDKYYGSLWHEAREKFAAALAEERAQERLATLNLPEVEALVETLKAQMKMRDMKSPSKLSEKLSWRENDDLANKLADEALAAFQALKEGMGK